MSATARLGTARPRSPSAAAASNEWADGFAWAAAECVQFHGITHCGPGPAFRHCWACGRRASLPGPGRQDRPGKSGRLRPLLSESTPTGRGRARREARCERAMCAHHTAAPMDANRNTPSKHVQDRSSAASRPQAASINGHLPLQNTNLTQS
jgi:recombinational DNA repair protein (RecF pathway)